MRHQLNDALLERYLQTFYGYGRLTAPYWFIGMEEGGENSVAEIAARLKAWSRRGQPEVDDLVLFHRATGFDRLERWFQPNPPLQRTWQQLIRLLLSAKRHLPVKEALRAYQANSLGRQSGETALLELLPLPAASTTQWPYANYSALSYLKDRRTYREHITGRRAAHLRARIREYAPRLVVFYSLTYRNDWHLISGSPFRPTSLPDFYLANYGATHFALTKHPTSHGTTSRYFEQAGALIAEALDQSPPCGQLEGGDHPEEILAPGTRVRHPSFGKGTVLWVKADGELVEVDFDSGQRKRLAVQLARLEHF